MRSPPSEIAKCRSTASRCSSAWWAATWTVSSAHFVQVHDRQMRALADDELDVLGVGAAAGLVDHDRRLGEALDPDLVWPYAVSPTPGPVIVTTTGSSSTTSGPTVTMVASGNDE